MDRTTSSGLEVKREFRAAMRRPEPGPLAGNGPAHSSAHAIRENRSRRSVGAPARGRSFRRASHRHTERSTGPATSPETRQAAVALRSRRRRSTSAECRRTGRSGDERGLAGVSNPPGAGPATWSAPPAGAMRSSAVAEWIDRRFLTRRGQRDERPGGRIEPALPAPHAGVLPSLPQPT